MKAPRLGTIVIIFIAIWTCLVALYFAQFLDAPGCRYAGACTDQEKAELRAWSREHWWRPATG